MVEYFQLKGADMANQVTLEIPREDVDELNALNPSLISTHNIQGPMEVVDLVVTLSAAATPIIAVFLTGRSKSPTGKRRVVLDGQRRVFENYEAEEVARILESARDEH
ncbi:hypothetical protein ACXN5S_13815 [Pseudoroseicyclus sp. H15]